MKLVSLFSGIKNPDLLDEKQQRNKGKEEASILVFAQYAADANGLFNLTIYAYIYMYGCMQE